MKMAIKIILKFSKCWPDPWVLHTFRLIIQNRNCHIHICIYIYRYYTLEAKGHWTTGAEGHRQLDNHLGAYHVTGGYTPGGLQPGDLWSGGLYTRDTYRASAWVFCPASRRRVKKDGIYNGLQTGSLLTCALQHDCIGVCSAAPLEFFTSSTAKSWLGCTDGTFFVFVTQTCEA